MSMTLSKRIYKYATLVFISIIAFLLILTMGMPSLGSYSSGNDPFVAAKVGSERIGKQEVERAYSQMMQTQFKGIDLPEQFKQQFRSQVVNQLVNQRLFYLLSVDAGLFPMEKASNKIVVDYLKKNYSEFLTPEGFDFERFEKDILKAYRINMDQVRRSAEWGYALGQNDTLFREFATATNGRDVTDQAVFANTKISYEILHISPAQRKEINLKRAKITEADIRAKFAADYLSKDPKDQLTDIKREAIKESLLQEKIAMIEPQWMKELKNYTGRLARAKAVYSGSLVRLDNISLNDSLQPANKAPEVNLAPLENDISFLENRVVEKALIGPIDIEGSLYMVKVISVKKPTPEELAMAELSGAPQTPQGQSNINVDTLYQQVFEFSKKQFNVIRY